MTIVSQRRIACYASLFTLVFALVLASPVRAQNANADAVPQKEVAAKLAYCEVCHGVSAQGFNGYYPIPRLAGQQIAYIENELQGFVEHKRTNNIMFNVGHVLSPAMIRALATDFHDLNPKPLGGAPKDNPHAFYEVKYKNPDGIIFDLTHNGWNGAVKEVVPAEASKVAAE